jgi:hypothetical protein
VATRPQTSRAAAAAARTPSATTTAGGDRGAPSSPRSAASDPTDALRALDDGDAAAWPDEAASRAVDEATAPVAPASSCDSLVKADADAAAAADAGRKNAWSPPPLPVGDER